MQQIADATGTSKPTLVRIAKHLGFQGWAQLTKTYLAELAREETNRPAVDPNVPFSATSSVTDIAESICKVKMEAARQQWQLLEQADLIKATDLMWHADRLALFGISINATLLELFQRKLFTIGISAILVPQAESGFVAEMLTERDCALMVSYSGDNSMRAPMRQLETLKQNRVPVIALTSMGDNYLRRMADCTLTILSNENLYSKISTFSTEEAITLILDTLFSCYFARAYNRNWNYKVSAAGTSEIERRAEHGRIER